MTNRSRCERNAAGEEAWPHNSRGQTHKLPCGRCKEVSPDHWSRFRHYAKANDRLDVARWNKEASAEAESRKVHASPEMKKACPGRCQTETAERSRAAGQMAVRKEGMHK